jgi:nucleoside-diphosphate-sugar epimerase
MVTILGVGGSIGSELVKELIARNESIRLVSRDPKLVPGVAEAAADLPAFDDTLKTVLKNSPVGPLRMVSVCRCKRLASILSR